MTGAQKRKLCVCITRLDLGGAQKIVLHHARGASANYDVTLFAGEGGRLDDEAREIKNARVHLSHVLKHPLSPTDPIALVRLAAYFKGQNFDIVHTHSSKAGALGRLAAKMAGVPCIVHTVHGWSFTPEQSAKKFRAYVQVEKLAAKACDKLICVSKDNRQQGLAQGIGHPAQYEVVYPAIETERFLTPKTPPEKVRAALGYKNENFVIGSIANLKAQKGPFDFVDVARRVVAQAPHARFFLAGDGPLRESVQQAIEKHGLSEQVKLLGWRNDPEDLLHAMNAFLLPSRFEGLPCSIVQAQSAGVAVVCTDVNGSKEVVFKRDDAHTGFALPAKDTEGMANALLKLINSKRLRREIISDAKNALQNRFDVRTLIDAYEKIYEEVLAQKTS